MNGLSFGLIAKIDVCSKLFPFAKPNGLVFTAKWIDFHSQMDWFAPKNKREEKNHAHWERRCDKNVAVSNMVYEKKMLFISFGILQLKKRLVNQTL